MSADTVIADAPGPERRRRPASVRTPRVSASGASALSRSVWQWQLILAFSSVTIGMAAAMFRAELFAEAHFVLGLLAVVAITATAIAVPWQRTGRSFVLAVPLADIVAVGMLNAGEEPLGYLWFFPIAWIATYYGVRQLATALLLVTVCLVFSSWGSGFSAAQALNLLMVMLALTFLGVTINIGTRRTGALRRMMRRESMQLRRALSRVRVERERTAELFDAITLPLARVDTGGVVEEANAAYRELYGLAATAFSYPAPAVEYDDYRGRALPPHETSVARAARGEAVTRERLWVYDAHGRWRMLELTILPARSRRGSTGSALIELVDRTPTDQAPRDRSPASVISHELRNPLTAILGHADLLLDDASVDERTRSHAEVIEGSATRMLTLIKGLLDDQRAPGSETSERFDLATVLSDAVAAFAPVSRAADIHLAAEIDPDLFMTGDAFRVRQVFDNLLSNAIKYTTRTGRVSVVALREDDALVVVVRDTGVGMSQEDADRVFEPYFRAQSAVDGDAPGTGLGMGIAREIIASHAGTIAVVSELGVGTAVTVRFTVTEGTDT